MVYFQCGLIVWGIWVMQGNTDQMMSAQSKVLAGSGAGIREQSAGMRASLERQS